MEKYHARFFVCHVLVNGDNVDFVLTQRFQDGLQLIFCDREVSINNGVVVASRERRPSVHAHILPHAYAMHCGRSAERELDHSILRFSLRSKDLVEKRSSNGTFFRQARCAEGILWIRIGRANLFGSVINFSHSTSQLIDCAFSFDVHEIDLWMVEEEM